MDKSNFGFIITRHVMCERTNKYWNKCVWCIRRFYPLKKIIIIDDNSNYDFVKAEFDYANIEVIQSEFKGRGELLPYYYFIKNKFFDNAVILHDSVFIHRRIHFEKLLGLKVIPLWFFYPDKENVNNTLRISNNLMNSIPIKQKIILNDNILGLTHSKWYGCFGVQSFINHEFLIYLENKYKISNMITAVKCREDRCSLERIFGCIFFTENQKILNKKSLFGDIMKYQKWGYSYDEYENDFKNKKVKKVVKVWTGR
jgi:hypothetical protein